MRGTGTIRFSDDVFSTPLAILQYGISEGSLRPQGAKELEPGNFFFFLVLSGYAANVTASCTHFPDVCLVLMQNVVRDALAGAQRPHIRSHVCSSARNAAQSASVCLQGPTGTSRSAPAIITGRPREVDQSAREEDHHHLSHREACFTSIYSIVALYSCFEMPRHIVFLYLYSIHLPLTAYLCCIPMILGRKSLPHPNMADMCLLLPDHVENL